jgi:hypothetical protein
LNDVIFVTEPEAGALYAARFLKDGMGQEFLKVRNDLDIYSKDILIIIRLNNVLLFAMPMAEL